LTITRGDELDVEDGMKGGSIRIDASYRRLFENLMRLVSTPEEWAKS